MKEKIDITWMQPSRMLADVLHCHMNMPDSEGGLAEKLAKLHTQRLEKLSEQLKAKKRKTYPGTSAIIKKAPN